MCNLNKKFLKRNYQVNIGYKELPNPLPEIYNSNFKNVAVLEENEKFMKGKN